MSVLYETIGLNTKTTDISTYRYLKTVDVDLLRGGVISPFDTMIGHLAKFAHA